MLGLGELRAVVRGDVILDSMADLFGCDVEVKADSHCGQHVVQVVAADEVGAHLVPLAAG